MIGLWLTLFICWLLAFPIIVGMGALDFFAWRRQREIDRIYGRGR